MVTIRLFEEAAGKLYQKGLIKGGIHASIGQEGVAVGVCTALRHDDWITSTHRGHGHHIAKGANLNYLMAEILGKNTGYCKGRGGSMHVAAFDIGSLGAYSIVASGVPIGVGAALSATMRRSDRVVVSFFGDGALGQGTLYESINLAALWKLPIVFLCENNQYAVSTKVDESIAVRDRIALFSLYGISSEKVDGQDVLNVYAATLKGVERARSGNGPVFIECLTYRYEGHYFGEPQVYRSHEEINNARQDHDPIIRFQKVLETEHGIGSEQLQLLENEAKVKVNESIDFALNSEEPAPDSYEEFVYA
jgi:TPP-dependent pyruvate/acetoin dehydrogenase alpha subunit